MDKSQRSHSDFWFARTWQKFKDQFPRLAKFRVRSDVEGETDKVPVRTGVYVPKNDPHGSLQFAWTGGGHGQLTEAQTFNEIGMDAFHAVGRDDLWDESVDLTGVPLLTNNWYEKA
jgi:hypothetical protein